jgi:hypothetical protein
MAGHARPFLFVHIIDIKSDKPESIYYTEFCTHQSLPLFAAKAGMTKSSFVQSLV